MIDFHCHLDLHSNPLALAKKADSENEFTLAVTTSPRAYFVTSQKLRSFRNIKCAIGLHPEIFEQKSEEQQLLLDNLEYCYYVGEIGIDGSKRYHSSINHQASFFEKIVNASEKLGGRVLSIHSRGAEAQVVDILDRYNKVSTSILHWFTKPALVERALSMNCYFSVNPVMLTSARGRQVAISIPLNRILPESDGPFTEISSRPIMPWEAQKIIPFLSKHHELPEDLIAAQLRKNMNSIIDKESLNFRPL